MILLAAIALPILFGALLPLFPFKKRAAFCAYVLGVTTLTSVLAAIAVLSDIQRLDLIHISEPLIIALRLDGLGKLFSGLVLVLWPLTTLYALNYMCGHGKDRLFFSFFMMSFGVTLGIAMSANLLTLYVFYEMLSLSTLPLVMCKGDAKSVAAGLKYLYYSLGGAAFAFIGLVYLVYFGQGTEFVPGGLFLGIPSSHTTQLQLGYLLCFFGFSVKAAVFPLHAWLPTASVAPTPVTALLHAVAVVKSGVFAILRVTFFSFGALVIKGSYAQYIPLALTAFTIVYGCSMALKETHIKRRLAYSTVSNLSYILFGALLLTPSGVSGGLMHMVFHAFMKITLFLIAGIYNIRANAYEVSDLRGISRVWPMISLTFLVASLSMTGIPPLIGFVSKWFLALAAVEAGGVLPFMGVAALLISAVLTGIYLLVPSYLMYSSKQQSPHLKVEPLEKGMQWTVVSLGIAVVVLSFYNKPLLDFLARIASEMV